jgi:hypothetical protein
MKTVMKAFVASMLLWGISAAMPASAQTYQIDPVHSSLLFRVKHMDTAYVYGMFTSMKGTVVVDEANPARSSINIEVDANSVYTHKRTARQSPAQPRLFQHPSVPHDYVQEHSGASHQCEHRAGTGRPDHTRRHSPHYGERDIDRQGEETRRVKTSSVSRRRLPSDAASSASATACPVWETKCRSPSVSRQLASRSSVCPFWHSRFSGERYCQQ